MNAARAALLTPNRPAPVMTPPSKLHIFCRRCGKETPASACDSTGLCVLCICADAIGPLKAEYERLWAKRERYRKRGLALEHVHEQLTSVARRLGDQVHARIANPTLAIATIQAHLQEVRDRVERQGSRIVIAKAGSLLQAEMRLREAQAKR